MEAVAISKIMTERVEVEAIQGVTLTLDVTEAQALYDFLTGHNVPMFAPAGVSPEIRKLAEIKAALSKVNDSKISIKR